MADCGVSKMIKNDKKVYIPPLPLPPARPEEGISLKLKHILFYFIFILTLASVARKARSLIRNNQLPAFGNRGQYGSQICFATFIWQKITNFLITQHKFKLVKEHRFVTPKI